MQGITGFLERYKDFIPPRRAASRAVCAAVKEILGVELAESDVRVQNGVATISRSGPEKSEILLHKPEIVSLVRQKTGASFSDVK